MNDKDLMQHTSMQGELKALHLRPEYLLPITSLLHHSSPHPKADRPSLPTPMTEILELLHIMRSAVNERTTHV
jgi:hypothetical protein